MNRNQLALLLVLLALAGVAAYMIKDWASAEPIQITCLIRPVPQDRQSPANRRDPPSGKRGYNVTFALNRKVTLTSIQVFPLQDVLTNKYPHAIWDLRSGSNAVPLKSLVYGERIRGFQPTVKGAAADPLEPGSSYRIVVKTDDVRAETDFQIPR